MRVVVVLACYVQGGVHLHVPVGLRVGTVLRTLRFLFVHKVTLVTPQALTDDGNGGCAFQGC